MSLVFKELEKDADVSKHGPLPVIREKIKILDWTGWKQMAGG